MLVESNVNILVSELSEVSELSKVSEGVEIISINDPDGASESVSIQNSKLKIQN